MKSLDRMEAEFFDFENEEEKKSQESAQESENDTQASLKPLSKDDIFVDSENESNPEKEKPANKNRIFERKAKSAKKTKNDKETPDKKEDVNSEKLGFWARIKEKNAVRSSLAEEKKLAKLESAKQKAKTSALEYKAAALVCRDGVEKKKNGELSAREFSVLDRTYRLKKSRAANDNKKYRRLLKNAQSKISVLTKVLIGIDIFAAICFFVMYGPFHQVRDTYITTAMSTSSHRYLANVFYSQQLIDSIVSENAISYGVGTMDTTAIKFTDVDSITSYSSVYEEQILKKDEGNDVYKLLEFDGDTYHGYIVVIYDASRITNVLSSRLNSGGQMLTEIAAENEAIVAINSGGFERSSSSGAVWPQGNYVLNGEVAYSAYRQGPLIGFNYDNVLVLLSSTAEGAVKEGMRAAVEFDPFLIVNGTPATVTGDGGSGKRPRTVIAQRQDGIVIMMVVDGKWYGTGISYGEMIDMLMLYKCYNAANLDGGGSSTLVINGELINSPAGWDYSGERYLADAWIVK